MTATLAPLGPIKYLTIHCAATPEGRDVKAAAISQWDIERFEQVSYHFVIEMDGTVVPTLPLTDKGAHVGGANSGNIGVCYVGGTDKAGNPKDTRTAAQRNAMRVLVQRLQAEHPGLIVRGHRDWPNVHKACPSFDVASWIREGMA